MYGYILTYSTLYKDLAELSQCFFPIHVFPIRTQRRCNEAYCPYTLYFPQGHIERVPVLTAHICITKQGHIGGVTMLTIRTGISHEDISEASQCVLQPFPSGGESQNDSHHGILGTGPTKMLMTRIRKSSAGGEKGQSFIQPP